MYGAQNLKRASRFNLPTILNMCLIDKFIVYSVMLSLFKSQKLRICSLGDATICNTHSQFLQLPQTNFEIYILHWIFFSLLLMSLAVLKIYFKPYFLFASHLQSIISVCSRFVKLILFSKI